MNREIKFRGIPLDGFVPTDDVDFDGKFIYGYYMKNGKDALIISGTVEPSDNLPCPKWFVDVDPKTVGQFTGMSDIDGVDIYENDIIHFGSIWCVGDEYDPREEEHIGAVEYHPDYASYVVNCDETMYPLEQMISFDGYSVQGNVHENSELLEEK